MNVINPYELLGFDSKNPNNISLSQLKKTYYNLSLICHPDKGGSPDVMIVLKNAYEYIKNQLENAKNHSTDFKTIENEFKEFLKEQTSKPPAFNTIYEETHDEKDWNTTFNEQFEKEKHKKPENPKQKEEEDNFVSFGIIDEKELPEEVSQFFTLHTDGYGHLMDIEKRDENNGDKEPTHRFIKDVMIYTDPKSYNSYGDGNMTDYMEAFTEDKNKDIKLTPPIETNNNNSDIEAKYQEFLSERDKIDNYMYQNVNNGIYNMHTIDFMNKSEKEKRELFLNRPMI